MSSLATLSTKKESPEIRSLRKAFNTAKLKDADGSLLACCAGNRGNSIKSLSNGEFVDDAQIALKLYNAIKDRDTDSRVATHAVLEDWFNGFVGVLEQAKRVKSHTGNVVVGLASLELSKICLLRQTIYNMKHSKKSANYFYSAWGVEFALNGINRFFRVIDTLKQEEADDTFKAKLEENLKGKRDSYTYSKDGKERAVDNLFFNGQKKENEPPLDVWLHRKVVSSVYNLIRCGVMSNVLYFKQQVSETRQWSTTTIVKQGSKVDSNTPSTDNVSEKDLLPLTFFVSLYDEINKDNKLTHNNKNPTKQIFENDRTFKEIMDNVAIVIDGKGVKRLEKKGKDFEDGFLVEEVNGTMQVSSWLNHPPKGANGACTIQ